MQGPNNNQTVPTRARILWPALGFPAVISPRSVPGTSPFAEGDATRSICVLVVSNKPLLSKEDAARYLRYVPWAQRGRRYIAAGQPGSFREVDVAVRNHTKAIPLIFESPKDGRAEVVAFGGNADGNNGVCAGLGTRVREFYRQQGLEYFAEIRVYEQATVKLPDGQYQLFWNNEVANEQAPSDEMALLLGAFARPRRSKLGQLWQQRADYLMKEYEYEYGAGGRGPRAEILHPLFINRQPSTTLRVGQVSDTHVDVRADVYEENLRQAGARVAYDNWNKAFVATYGAAKQDSDVILLTGDLIDYGRGAWGPSERNRLGDDAFYQEDRNWFLFYRLLASGNSYSRPAYTILGNHDWRLNPYPPMAIAGAPGAEMMIFGTQKLSDAEQRAFFQQAHGPGFEPKVSYDRKTEADFAIKLKNTARLGWLALRVLFGGKKTMDEPHFPTETSVESIAWYLLSINPFLDYWFTLPTGHGVLMLDWAEKESVFFGDIYQGKRYASFDKHMGDEGPTAKNCLTSLQMVLVNRFTADHPSLAKIIGIHAPPISPWDDWNEQELRHGWKDFDMGGRGYPRYSAVRDGKKIQGHPLFAIQPAKGVVPDAVFGMDASWNSFEQNRPEFIRRVSDPRCHVRLVMSGHIHRAGLFAAYRATAAEGDGVAGEMRMESFVQNEVRMVRSPAAGSRTVLDNAGHPIPVPGPLYVTTTSTGPRGHNYPAKGIHLYMTSGYTHAELVNDGTIRQVLFRWLDAIPAIAPASPTTVQPQAVPRAVAAPPRPRTPVGTGGR